MNLNAALVMPEVVILTAACLILLVDLFVPDDRRHVSYWLTQFALLVAMCVTVRALRVDVDYAFHRLVIVDMVADLLRMCSFLAVSAMLFYSRTYLMARGLFKGETFVLILFALLGMQVLITANHFLTLYLGLELMSLSLYALVALQRDNPKASEAAMKYFVLGALASGILLYGMSMIYGATGSLEIDKVARAIAGGGTQPGATDLRPCIRGVRRRLQTRCGARITCGSRTFTRARPRQSRCSLALHRNLRRSR